MTNPNIHFTAFVRCLVSTMTYLFLSCNNQGGHDRLNEIKEASHLRLGFWGDSYQALGFFRGGQSDSIETNLWSFTDLTRPMAMYGEYSNGYPSGKWNIIFRDGTGFSSNWSLYKNTQTSCSFSVPFSFEETTVDSFFFKLSVKNDSLGKISIIVGVNGSRPNENEFGKFASSVDEGVTEQGYAFTKSAREVSNKRAKYFFSEYSMKDSTNMPVKLYNVFGYSPSRRNFVEFTLVHNGPKEEWVKIIYDLMVTSLYVNGERFFNPYVRW